MYTYTIYEMDVYCLCPFHSILSCMLAERAAVVYPPVSITSLFAENWAGGGPMWCVQGVYPAHLILAVVAAECFLFFKKKKKKSLLF